MGNSLGILCCSRVSYENSFSYLIGLGYLFVYFSKTHHCVDLGKLERHPSLAQTINEENHKLKTSMWN